MDLIQPWFEPWLSDYSCTPESDKLIFEFLVTYLVVLRGFSIDSVRNFTTYDFINLRNNHYWILTEFETRLLRLYFHCIRKNDQEQKNTVLVPCPCGKYVYLSGIFFVPPTGYDVSVNEEMANDLINDNFPKALSTQGSGRSHRRRSRTLSITGIRNSSTKRNEVYEKCLLQQWTGIDVDENCPGGRGRGIIAAKNFTKNEIVVDYHARPISSDEATAIEDDPEDARFSYLFCGPNGLFWDGSAEFCECHPQSRLLGRLANFAQKGSKECNMIPQLFQFKTDKLFQTIILVATREILIEEELRFDYGDNACLELFK